MQKDRLKRTMFCIEQERWGTSPVPQPALHPPGAGALAIALLSEVGHQPAPLCTI